MPGDWLSAVCQWRNHCFSQWGSTVAGRLPSSEQRGISQINENVNLDCTQTILQGVSLSKSLRLGISTSSVEGKSSKVMEIIYRGRPLSVRQTMFAAVVDISLKTVSNNYVDIEHQPRARGLQNSKT